MKTLTQYINKEILKNEQKLYLEIFMILDQISREKNIISFTYQYPNLLVRVSYKDYYKIEVKGGD